MESKEQVYRWKVHLAREQPGKVVAVLLIAIACGFLGFWMVQSPLMLVFGPVVILLGTADFLLPVTCEIGPDGAKSRCGLSVSAMSWSEVKRVLETEDGVKLSPLEHGSRMNAFRGVFLRANRNKQEIVDRISYWREQHAANVGTAPDGRTEGENNREDLE